MAMVKAGKGGGEIDVDRLLNFEKRSGIKDGDIESFITKVDAVNVAIQAMKDGELDPADVHVDGVPTIEEELQMAAEKRRRRIDLEKREREARLRQKKEEGENWWRGAELLYGERKRMSGIGALENSTHPMEAESSEENHLSHISGSTRSLTEEERMQLKDRYSMEYGRWDTWTPTDPASLAEIEGREEEEDAKRCKEFETNNPEFCTQMIDDMKTRSEASDKKDSEATAARLKGNRFYRAKRWEKALELYMASLRARPYTVNTLANVAQTLIKLERWSDALDFCDRALHVDGLCVKALSRRATIFINLAGQCLASSSNATATATATAAAATCASLPGRIGVEVGESKGDAIGVSAGMRSVLNTENREAVGTAGDEGEKTGDNDNDNDDGGADQALYDRFGGREGLLALALVDLETAVGAEPESEDVRRQRDALKTEIDEEKVEAEVMKIARSVPRTRSRIVSATDSSEREEKDPKAFPSDANKGNDLDRGIQRSPPHLDGLVNDTVTPQVAFLPEGGTASSAGDARLGTPRARNGDTCSGKNVPGEDDFTMVDRALEEALGEGVTGRQGLWGTTKKDHVANETIAALQSLPLLNLAKVLEASSSARVYFRASGGLARLAGATRAASLVMTAAVADHRTGHSADPPSQNNSSATPSTTTASAAAATTTTATSAGTAADAAAVADATSGELASSHGSSEARSRGNCEGAPMKKQGTGDISLYEHAEKRGLATGNSEALMRRVELMLRALAAALLGGERLAQQDVLRSGLLDGPCGKALLMVSDQDVKEGSAAIGRTVDVAGSAATVLSRVVTDPNICAHVSRSVPLLSGVLGLVGADSATPLDVQAAAAILSTVLLGRTASAAAKTLQDATAVKALPGIGSPTMVVTKALLAWKKGSGLMQGAPPSTGSSLCGVLANLAMHEEFRGSFAESSSLGMAGRNNNEQITPVKVLVLVAGDTKARCSEARPLALAALANASLHHESVQTATISAGGLALALAVLSLEDEERAHHFPPLVLARSAGLLARLSTLPAALKLMVRPGIIDRIIKATVRSAALGSNIYATAKSYGKPDPADEPARTTHAMEREHLVRTLATILRSNTAEHSLGPKDTAPSPSSTVNTAAVPEGRGSIADTAKTLGLAEALVSFLPPAREEGLQRVTRESVALKPTWSAAPALTANVGCCLLHLMDGECSAQITEQVVAAGGIPRLVSLFANPGAEGGAKSARANAGICLAKLAREPRHKEAIANLRGMEMLVQAGTDLAV